MCTYVNLFIYLVVKEFVIVIFYCCHILYISVLPSQFSNLHVFFNIIIFMIIAFVIDIIVITVMIITNIIIIIINIIIIIIINIIIIIIYVTGDNSICRSRIFVRDARSTADTIFLRRSYQLKWVRTTEW